MHRVELDKKLRLPDPAKAVEGVWKLLRRTQQQVNIHGPGITGSKMAGSDTLKAQRLAKLEAERKKSLGASYALKTTIR